MTLKQTGNANTLLEQLRALEKLEGYPLAPTHVGEKCRHLVSQTYVSGAVGWTNALTHIEVDEKGDAFFDVPDEVIDRQGGKRTSIDGKEVMILGKGNWSPVTGSKKSG
jgi:hypothetical protein